MRALRASLLAVALPLLVPLPPAGTAGTADPTAADPIFYASAERSAAAPPARYAAPLPPHFDLRPAADTWVPRMDVVGASSPSHLQHRACHEGAPERERIVAAVRDQVERGVFDSSFLGVSGLNDCADAPAQISLCAWLARVATSDEPAGVREVFLDRALGCGDYAVALVERPEVSAERVVGFYGDRWDGAGSPRLAAIVRERVQAGDPLALADAAFPFGRSDDPRAARTLLAAHDEATDPRVQRILALAMERQSDPEARERFERARRASCEEIAAARAEDRLGDDWLFQPARRVEALASCLPSFRGPGPFLPLDPRSFANDPEEIRRRTAEAALRERGIAFQYGELRAPAGEGLLEVAGMVRRLLDLVQPALDPAIVEEVWPALDALAVDRGPVEAWVPVPGDALPTLHFRAHLPGRPGEPDPTAVAAFGRELRAALDAPHFLDVHLDGERFRFVVEPVGRAVPRATVLGAVNELLRARGSDVRVAALDAPALRGAVAGPEWAVRELLRGDLRSLGAEPATPGF